MNDEFREPITTKRTYRGGHLKERYRVDPRTITRWKGNGVLPGLCQGRAPRVPVQRRAEEALRTETACRSARPTSDHWFRVGAKRRRRMSGQIRRMVDAEP